MISVENLVAEKIPSLANRSPKIRQTIVAFFRYLFHEQEFRRFEEAYPYLEGFDFVDQVLDYFEVSYTARHRDRERIPATGRVVIIANHPVGSLDGLALLKLVSEVRRDVRVVANDMLLTIKPLNGLLLPVDNMERRTTRQNIRSIESHLNDNGAVIIFPAGEVSRMSAQGIRDGRWNSGFLRLAVKTRAPVLPVHIDARNSVFFYSLSLLARPLSTLWLIREMFKHSQRDIKIRISHPVEYMDYVGLPLSKKVVVKLFKKHVYQLAKKDTGRIFVNTHQSIAHPEQRQYLRNEIRNCEKLGQTNDGKQIFLYHYKSDSYVMREISRLREVSFRAVGEGSGQRRDWDQFDSLYDHIILWDDEQLEIVGAYRLVRTSRLVAESGFSGLYSNTLFEYSVEAMRYMDHGVELGRSFVQPRYWGKRSLDYLWYGIGAYLNKYKDVRYLFGPVSISNSYPDAAKHQIVSFYQKFFSSSERWANARQPFTSEVEIIKDFPDDYQAAFVSLKEGLSTQGLSVPVLYKQYTELCETGGVEFVDFNIDDKFSDCIDGLVLVDIHKLKDARRKRYLGDKNQTV